MCFFLCANPHEKRTRSLFPKTRNLPLKSHACLHVFRKIRGGRGNVSTVCGVRFRMINRGEIVGYIMLKREEKRTEMSNNV